MTPSDAPETFRTVYRAVPSPMPLSPEGRMLLLGSCFTDNVGAELRRRMVPASVNPTGTLFNPLSIARVITAALDSLVPKYEEHDGHWDSWLLPGKFSAETRDEAEALGNAALTELCEELYEADTLIVTFGSAIVYALARPPYDVVANCHKQPSSTFFRDMLAPSNIAAEWIPLLARLRSINPRLRVILTVSPVRHLREGFRSNSLSKATLLLAAEQICRATDACDYFPAYEIVTDDLRDYRFYADDMAHPSRQAVEYVYSLFEQTYFDAAGRALLDEALSLRRRLEHRPLHPGSDEDVRFRAATADALEAFLTAHPAMKP